MENNNNNSFLNKEEIFNEQFVYSNIEDFVSGLINAEITCVMFCEKHKCTSDIKSFILNENNQFKITVKMYV